MHVKRKALSKCLPMGLILLEINKFCVCIFHGVGDSSRNKHYVVTLVYYLIEFLKVM